MSIRKTNYRPYTSVVRIRAGQTARFADGDRPLLKDLILEMLDSLIQSEPHRASHLVDKGHYLYINNRLEEAARAFVRAEEVVSTQPVFPDDMPAEERAAELRLYAADRKRVSREVARHRRPESFDFSKARDFNLAYEKAKRNRLLENVDSWDWVAMRGRGLVGEAQYLQAMHLYEAHLDRVGNGESAIPCALELVKVRLLLRDMSGFRIVFDKLRRLAGDDHQKLLAAVRTILPYQDRLRTSQRPELLGLLSEPLQRIVKEAAEPLKGECAVLLGEMLVLQGRRSEALPYLLMAVKGAKSEEEKEERSLQVAEALRMARRSKEAKEWYSRLVDSPRESIRKRARAGLILLGVNKR
jgi:tetratricopeptide (TPR) repeat protein